MTSDLKVSQEQETLLQESSRQPGPSAGIQYEISQGAPVAQMVPLSDRLKVYVPGIRYNGIQLSTTICLSDLYPSWHKCVSSNGEPRSIRRLNR